MFDDILKVARSGPGKVGSTFLCCSISLHLWETQNLHSILDQGAGPRLCMRLVLVSFTLIYSCMCIIRHSIINLKVQTYNAQATPMDLKVKKAMPMDRIHDCLIIRTKLSFKKGSRKYTIIAFIFHTHTQCS